MGPRRLAMTFALWLLVPGGSLAAQVLLPPVPPPTATVQGQEAEGQVSRLNRADRTITLDTGVEYAMPEALDPAWARLADGVAVKLRYDTDGGRNIVTQIQIGAR
jgi:hypothetical protein